MPPMGTAEHPSLFMFRGVDTETLSSHFCSVRRIDRDQKIRGRWGSAKEMRMRNPEKRTAHRILMFVSMLIVGVSATVGPPTSRAVAVEVGDRAPDFTLPSTNGVDISLHDFKGKKWVFLEFYAAAFVPT